MNFICSLFFFGILLNGKANPAGAATPDSAKTCSEVHRSATGYIKSPNFPNKYPNNANCRYLITNSDPATRIILDFLHFDLESHRSCSWDWLKIYDGNSNKANQIGRKYGYCGKRAPPTLTIASTGNSLLMVFVSDHIVPKSGFNATYRGHGVNFYVMRYE